jgi:HPt (histidine-containing phosphotransfer) domain-containing protein
MKNKSVLDIESFKSFTGDEIDHQITMIDLFSVQTSVYLNELKNSLHTNNNEDWHDTAHKLKGMSSFCGAISLHELCTYAQDNHLAPYLDKIDSLTQIEDEINAVNLAFKNYLKRL